MRGQPIKQISLTLSSTDITRGSFLDWGFLFVGLVFLGAVGAEQTSTRACFAVWCHREPLLADFTVRQLARLWPLPFLVDFVCQEVVIFRILVLTTRLALREFFGVFNSCNRLLSFALFDQIFWRVGRCVL